MKYLITACSALLFLTFSNAQTTQSYFINFDFDSFILDENSEKTIAKISKTLKEKSEYSVEIIGHTDQDGSLEYNRILSDQRAKEVYDFMLDQGVSLKNIQYSSLGERNLLISKNDDLSKSKNRRVEIKTHIIEINSLEDLISLIDSEDPRQNFIVPTDQPYIITAREGSTIEIPANAFVFEDGSSPNGNVQVEIIESFDYNSFAENGLSCNSGEDLLESGGMMKISATADGRELQIREDKNLAVTYPKSQIKKDMQLFYAEPEPVGATNWIVTDSEVETNLVDVETTTEIDMQQFIADKLERPVAPNYKFKRIPAKPRHPALPIKPFKPIEPKKESIRVNLSKWQKLSMSATKKEALKEKVYQEKYAKYGERLARFEKLTIEYKQALIDHKIALKETDRKIEEWNQLCRKKYKEVYQYQIALRRYALMEKMWFAQNNLLVKDELKNDEKTFWAFYNLSVRRTLVGDVRHKLEKVFGSDFDAIHRNVPGVGSYNEYTEAFTENYTTAQDLERKAQSIAFKLGFIDKDNITANSLGQYAMTVSKLGWINCDRFLKIPFFKRRQIALVHEKETKFFLVFNDMKSMLIAKNEGSFHKFNGLPSDTKVTVVGLQVIDKQPYLFTKELSTTENFKIAPTFKKSSVAEISHFFDTLYKNS